MAYVCPWGCKTGFCNFCFANILGLTLTSHHPDHKPQKHDPTSICVTLPALLECDKRVHGDGQSFRTWSTRIWCPWGAYGWSESGCSPKLLTCHAAGTRLFYTRWRQSPPPCDKQHGLQHHLQATHHSSTPEKRGKKCQGHLHVPAVKVKVFRVQRLQQPYLQ